VIYLLPFINLIVAVWVFYDSQKRGFTIWRGLLWAVAVSLALIVFLPLYLVARKRKERLLARERETEAPAPLTSCFYCGQGYTGDPKVCPYCGQNLKM
jgi:hypothetical protein